MTKLDLTKLEEIQSPEELDNQVLSAATRVLSKPQVSFFKKTGGYAIAYSFGVLSFVLGGLLLDSSIGAVAPTISLDDVTLRGTDSASTRQINVTKLSDSERKDLLVELVIQNELQQAEALINWMNKQKEK